MKKTRVAIIGTAGLPANYGGFETLAERLVEELGAKLKLSVYCSSKKYKKEDRRKKYKGARLYYLPFSANGMQSIIYDTISILHALFYADVLLILGVPGCFILPFVRLFTNKKIVTSVDGIEWKRNKWSKLAKLFLWASEWIAVKFSHASIADNESIQDYTAIRYKTLSNIIEYGADHTSAIAPEKEDFGKYPFLARAYAISVCRIEPENNIHMILEAFAKLPSHNLVLIGNWNNSAYGLDLKKKYTPYNNILLINPIYNQREIDLLRSNATVYIHGHSAGGTNPSLVEAMNLGLPVVSFSVMYNRTTTEGKALYFKNSAELIGIIRKEKIKDLKEIGNAMKQIADRRYTWRIIAGKYHFLIKSVTQKKRSKSLQPSVAQVLSSEKINRIGLSHLQTPLYFYEKR